MRPFLFSLFCLLLLQATAQESTIRFSLNPPAEKITGSLYSTIAVTDIRYDSSNLGMVQQGFSKKNYTVVPDTSFNVQAQKVLDAIAPGAGNGHLLMLLRFFKFTELMDRSKQTGYCYFRANMYAKKDGRYFPLSVIDTAIVIRRSSYAELNALLFKESSHAITAFISKNLVIAPVNADSYTLEQLVQVDSIEKRAIPIYSASSFKDGIYLTYPSFKNQVPDLEIKSVDTSDNEIAMLHAKKQDGGTLRVNPRELYAVIHAGTIYMPAGRGYGILKKRDNDFYLKGEAAVTYDNVAGHKIVGAVLLGAPGILSNPKASYRHFEMKLDHLDGLLIKIRELSREEIKRLKQE